MRSSVFRCDACGLEVKGRFRDTLFSRLGTADQELLEQYLLAEFSIKELARRSSMGYTAIRSRLDRLITEYRSLLSGEKEKQSILCQLAAGEISAAEAREKIENIGISTWKEE